jgi:hypothetical protein
VYEGRLVGPEWNGLTPGKATRSSASGIRSGWTDGAGFGGWIGNRCRIPRVARRSSARTTAAELDSEDEKEGEVDGHGEAPESEARLYDTRRVLRFMKSMRMNWPNVIVLVK